MSSSPVFFKFNPLAINCIQICRKQVFQCLISLERNVIDLKTDYYYRSIKEVIEMCCIYEQFDSFLSCSTLHIACFFRCWLVLNSLVHPDAANSSSSLFNSSPTTRLSYGLLAIYTTTATSSIKLLTSKCSCHSKQSYSMSTESIKIYVKKDVCNLKSVC